MVGDFFRIFFVCQRSFAEETVFGANHFSGKTVAIIDAAFLERSCAQHPSVRAIAFGFGHARLPDWFFGLLVVGKHDHFRYRGMRVGLRK